MNQNRRQFIRTASAGLATAAFSGVLAACSSQSRVSDNTAHDFGIQLYTLRDVMPKDPKSVLKQLAAMGYKQIESYEAEHLGMFWGMKPKEFKSHMDDLGMSIVSSHCAMDAQLEQKAADAAAIGMKYLIVPSVGPQKDLDSFKRIAEQFNKSGEICRKAGIRFGYHNHDYTFKTVEGRFPQDVLMEATDPELVDFEMDIYWVHHTGQDPIAWFEKYPGRFRLSHIKDGKKNAKGEEITCTLGTGIIDFPAILAVGKKQGLQYYLVEQEHYEGTTPLQAAAKDADYMKNLRI